MLLGLIISALLLGLAGGPHCLAMCGGLCVSLRGTSSPWEAGAWRSDGTLHAGRVVAYAALGAGAGGLVQTMAWASDHLALFKPAWALLHAAMLAWGLMLLVLARQPMWAERAAQPVWRQLRRMQQTPLRSAMVGTGWALLPCGLLYSALILAGLSGGVWQGALIMLAFALPTCLWLMGATWLAGGMQLLRQPREQRLTRRFTGLLLAAGSAWALWQHAAHGIRAMC
ncbi:MAG: sulfite exporter TauE/SafE family protein [Brachymonas sp.]